MSAISIKNLTKEYLIPINRPILAKNLIRKNKTRKKVAIDKINLEVSSGESIGVIGKNGSGKSTLLKIIAGITFPTNGKVTCKGKVSSIIELGAGFHPDLTGKENLYINAALMGYSKNEIKLKFEKIEKFADIGEYINQPTRTYSSGMKVRLGFSLAIHTDPDILLVDEVLSVGDEEYQQRCIKEIYKMKKRGVTIIFVSHDLNLISRICDRAICFNNGEIITEGNVGTVISTYIAWAKKNTSEIDILGKGTGEATIKSIIVNGGKKVKEYESFSVVLSVLFNKTIKNPVFGIVVSDKSGRDNYSSNTLWHNVKTGIHAKGKISKITFNLNGGLIAGNYSITPAIANRENLKHFYEVQNNVSKFKVYKSPTKPIEILK